MSKSAPDPASRILLTDSYDQIRKKLRGAVTDNDPAISYDPINRPGTSNLLTILGACTGQDARSCVPPESGHGKLKERVAEAIEAKIGGPRQEYMRLREDPGYLEEVAKSGAAKARELSNQTLHQVRKMIGLA
jgi:tryptophanyl-tRNA synthetase